MIFRRGLEEQLVRVASRFALLGLVCLLTTMAAAVDLVVSVVAGPVPAAGAAMMLAVFAGASWFAAPMYRRRRFPRL